MFERLHHQRIARVLAAFDTAFLQEADCYFGGGTAIVMALSEYRESRDIDFLCASTEGYRLLRNTITQQSLGRLLKSPLSYRREIRADRYGIRTVIDIDGVPIKLEIVNEGRIRIGGSVDEVLSVPVLCRADMYAEKLLANADRGQDRSTLNRDIIDLAMMIAHWGEIPSQAWEKAESAYGQHVARAYHDACGMIRDLNWLKQCLERMQMDPELSDCITRALVSDPRRASGMATPLSPDT
ncbi:MAG: nucleotidyl transferase AbiEii/AbiGii toxin family protein [Lautropia sp.]|nr:nucleotidyl transferase AbiEii/AbiGii toxin family protein [Lautropia sp.]